MQEVNFHDLRFDAPLPIGAQILWRGQTFTVAEHRPHTLRTGGETTLLRWQFDCAECGRNTDYLTGWRAPRLSRRCVHHSRKGRLLPKGKRGPKGPAVLILPESLF